MSKNGEIYTTGKFYTPAGTDGMDKFHLWLSSDPLQTLQSLLVVKIVVIALSSASSVSVFGIFFTNGDNSNETFG